MIGLVGAMAVEVEGMMQVLQDRREQRIGMDTFVNGKLYGQDAVLAVCGAGKINAALCTQSMILHYHPDWVLNLGVAGSADESISIGDMVIADSVVQHDVDTSPIGDPVCMVSKINLVNIPCDKTLGDRLVAAATQLQDCRVFRGVIATGDQFINDGEKRNRIRSLTDALCVEMEGGAVAQACWMHGVPCGVLRSISDQADGHSDMDYPAFVRLAAEHSQRVIELLLKA